MKNLIFLSILVTALVSQAEISKECVNIGEIADVTTKAFLNDGQMFVVRVADIQVATPLHPVANLVSFVIEDGVMKINFTSSDRFLMARKFCARNNVIAAYSNAACKLGAIAERLKPFPVHRDGAVEAMNDSRSAREGVDGVQANAELLSKGAGDLNKRLGLNLIKIWNEVSGNNLNLNKARYVSEDINPLKASLEKMIGAWTGKPVACPRE